jgi:fumarylacetoacetate (FAA) hydrolase family protein
VGGLTFDAAAALPADWRAGLFLGRIDRGDGPTPIMIANGAVYDMARVAPTTAQLVANNLLDPSLGERIGELSELSLGADEAASTRILSPVDLQCVKAAGVTFAVSAIERVIEERARGDAGAAQGVREKLEDVVGGSLRNIAPGSPAAAALKNALIADGMWSQYLEVAIGPDAEIFSKCPPLASVGWGAPIGVRSDSSWNNPEPEVVLLCTPHGKPVGAMLGNDVNLRDFEGRSALLLSKAKDNNASAALGPFVRLFGADFTLDDVRAAEVELRIDGADGYILEGSSSMSQISRDPAELARQTMSEHQYPDGFALYLGTLFAPVKDRDEPGGGFTHKIGDIVTISSPRLGTLRNQVTTSREAAPWTFGLSALMSNLANRGLLTA